MPDSSTTAAPTRRRRWPAVAAAGAVVALIAAAAPATGSPTTPGFEEYGFQGEGEARIRDLDVREGRVAPTKAQRATAERLGATSVSWNAFGTPHIMVNHNGYLSGPREGTAVDAARGFVRDHAALFRLTPAEVDGLEVLRDSPLYDSPDLGRVYREGKPPKNPDVAHSVLFTQRFEGLPAAVDGLLTIGVQSDGRIASVSSSITGDTDVQGSQQLSATEAIRAAARDVDLKLGKLTEVEAPVGDFLTFTASETADLQRARLFALPTPTNGVRRVWEVTLQRSEIDEHGNPAAFISFIDAQTGKLWHRSNRVDHFAQGFGPSTVVGAHTALPSTQDNGLVQLPTWRVFPANPPFVGGLRPEDVESVDTRVLWCWDNGRDPEECAEEQRNTASRLPWDTNAPSLPSFTTDGNNASTAISEASFQTPDTAANRPVSPTREYDYAWRNAWFEGSCNPLQFGASDSFVGGGPNDESASTANLFVQHNRMHDWSYYLGFTEVNYNMQKNNFGNTGPDRENDPELGSSQAGRRTVNGRDNANQRTLQDGIAPITNQYLWQPLAGAFYSPCVDGAYDQAVVAHEYGHAITNRMLGGPNGGTGATQGQTESWSDLQFAAYFTEFTISAGEGINPYVLGPYVTGDPVAGIRNYAMNDSPLNYSNLDYDGTGLGSPHANGEIWSATNFDILASFNRKYDAQFPSKDQALQVSCARGERPAQACPGNRRWNQVQYDSYLLQPSGVTMIDSRDMMLAADRLRFKGANQNELWDAFAKRGLGVSAKSVGPTDVEAVPGWDSPLRSDEARITFAPPAGANDMQVFVGKYEARVTPVADTIADSDEIGTTVSFVPGTYEFIATAPGFGGQRFTQTFAAGETRTVAVPLRRNLASRTNGGEATGDGVNLEQFIDDTEATNWASLTGQGTASQGKGEGAQVEGRQVTFDLAGDSAQMVREVQMSAALRGPITETESGDLPPDPGSQSRFSALRSFEVLACNAAAGANCEDAASYKKIFTSSPDAFPGGRPRPRVPDLILRPFDVDDTQATHLRMVVIDNQCTGGPAFQGEVNPDADPAFNPDCDTQASSPDRLLLRPPTSLVRATEFQVFSDLSVPSNFPGTSSGDPATNESSSPNGTRGGAGDSVAQPSVARGMLPATGLTSWPGLAGAVLLLLGGYGALRARRTGPTA